MQPARGRSLVSPESARSGGPQPPEDPREVLTRAARPPDAVLPYGPHPEQLLDVHLPPEPGHGPASVVVLLHGGFWRQAFDRTHTRPLAEALSAEGHVVVTPEFRRVGGAGGWPMTFEDVVDALSALSTLGEAVPGRVDERPPTLVGHSAGGQLAIWAALRDHASPVHKVVALAPVADLREAYDRGLGEGAVAALMGGSPAELSEEYTAADAAGLLPGRVPVTVVHGALDERVPVEMSRRLRGVEYVELPDVEHFGLIDPLSPAWPTVRCAVLTQT